MLYPVGLDRAFVRKKFVHSNLIYLFTSGQGEILLRDLFYLLLLILD